MAVSLGFGLQFMRFKQVTGHSEGRAADGTTGKECRKTVWQGQVGTLQASGKKDPKDDKKGQKARRKDASSAEIESVFLLTLHISHINKVFAQNWMSSRKNGSETAKKVI